MTPDEYVKLTTQTIPNLARRLSVMDDQGVPNNPTYQRLWSGRRKQLMHELHEALGAALADPEPNGRAWLVAFDDTDDFAPRAIVKGSEEDAERVSKAMAKRWLTPEHLMTTSELPFYNFEES